MYKIIGWYKSKSAEILDTADNKLEASKLAEEYRLAFGNDWIIEIKLIKIKH